MPIANGTVGGVDALLSSVQMPPGIPLASVGIAGARNAGLYAAAILAANGGPVSDALTAYRASMEERVKQADARVREKLAK